MWCNHIPKLNIIFPSKLLVSWNKRPYRKFTFHNVLARQGSSFYNGTCLNFQAFALCDMKMAAQEGCHVGQKMAAAKWHKHELSF